MTRTSIIDIYIISAFATAEAGVSPRVIGIETPHFAENSFSAQLQKELSWSTRRLALTSATERLGATTAGRHRSTVPRETGDGRPVTVSFGQGGRTDHTLIADGHVSGSEFYHRGADADEKGHDHYGPHGESFGDYGKYSG